MKTIIKNMALTMSIAGISLSATAAAVIGSQLEQQLQNMTVTDSAMVVVSYDQLDALTTTQLQSLLNLGLTQGVQFKSLPIIGVMANANQINHLATMPGVRSVFANRSLEYYNAEARQITGVEKLQSSTFDSKNGIKYTGKGVTVIVNDSGIDATLDDLEYGVKVIENVQGVTHAQALSLTGVDGMWLEGQRNTDLNVGHGTHCAGTVGGWGTHSDGKYQGAAPGADIIGYGSGAGLSILDALGGYDYATTHVFDFNSPIRVMSNSWGSSGKYAPAGPISLASYKAHRLGVISVFAAGNSGSGEDTHNPYAQIPWGMSVGASTKQGDLIDFSSRGKRGETGDFTMPDGSTWTYKNEVTIVAPGVDIISTRAKTNLASNGGADDVGVIENEYLPFYTRISGTSMAAPHVAGIIALMWEANPDLTNLQIKTILQETATNMPGYQSWEVGAGHVNAYAAVAGALAYDEQNRVTVNNLNTFNANAIIIDDEAPEPFSVLFTPAGEPEVHVFNVQDDAAWISASSETLANLVKLKLEAPDGTVYFGNLTTPVLSSTMRVSAPAQTGEWKLSAFGITSLSGVQADPTGTTNGPGIPEYIEGEISILTSGGYEGLNDIAGHPAEKAIEFAVSERLVDSKNDQTYRPDAKLRRKELAQYLVMGMSIRQQRGFLNDNKTVFTDVNARYAPFVDAVTETGSALKDRVQNQAPVMISNGDSFQPHAKVNKQELAYSLVQALGLATQVKDFSGEITVEYNGERIAIMDSSEVATELKGYVQAAIDMSLIGVRFAIEQGPYDLSPTVVAYFEPASAVKRGDYAVIISRLYDSYLRK
ncbi:S8 family peptidase [Colwellia hornerae]|uniref:S8 family serine peptidase n=1 Tax=Colwellia hornerae TaxID=89402 RepID=A0A5C6QTJ0_9GAMM|nr:S8 family serine peptidase [Colwellia hornerae]TWX56871.1 S8 family serine peptidase [Colwellia hornerae]TWX62404.1 S8 family serine peptidase [Colwellia hornerae]TWX72264.1 S8 family serine peptidase [Colwellia hornerae]